MLKYANIKLLVARQNKTPRELLAHIIGDLEKRNIENINLILNDVKITGNGYAYHYNYGYGYYGYDHDEGKKSFKNRLMSVFSKS